MEIDASIAALERRLGHLRVARCELAACLPDDVGLDKLCEPGRDCLPDDVGFDWDHEDERGAPLPLPVRTEAENAELAAQLDLELEVAALDRRRAIRAKRGERVVPATLRKIIGDLKKDGRPGALCYFSEMVDLSPADMQGCHLSAERLPREINGKPSRGGYIMYVHAPGPDPVYELMR